MRRGWCPLMKTCVNKKKKKETTLLFVKHFPAVYGKFCGYCARADERPWQLQSFMLSSQYKKIFSYRWLVAIFRNCTMGSVKWVEMGKEIGPRQRERLWRTKEGLLWQKKKKTTLGLWLKERSSFPFMEIWRLQRRESRGTSSGSYRESVNETTSAKEIC